MSSACPLGQLWRTVPPDLVSDGVPEIWIPGHLVLTLLPGCPGVGRSTAGHVDVKNDSKSAKLFKTQINIGGVVGKE